MDAATRRLVRERAQDQCEYCRLSQEVQPYVIFHVEHIVPRKHGGSDDPMNEDRRVQLRAELLALGRYDID